MKKITAPQYVVDKIPKDQKYHAVTYDSREGWRVDDQLISSPVKTPIAIGRQDGALIKNDMGVIEDVRVKKVLLMLDEIEKAEQTNWKTGQAMPIIHRKLKRAVTRAELMSHAWGRIKLARQIREMLTK